MIHIDGSQGEGGGQILRTALALSVVTGQPFHMDRIRANRRKPGLAPQHLAGVIAAARICGADVQGAGLRTQALAFTPGGTVQPGRYVLDIGELAGTPSAGSVTMLLQTVLLPLALAGGPSELVLRGGTHVRWSPPAHYAMSVLLPTLNRMGVEARAQLNGTGWYPEGGGELVVEIGGGASLVGIDLSERGDLVTVSGEAVACSLPEHVAQRMADEANTRLRAAGLPPGIQPVTAKGRSTGAGLFITVTGTGAAAGFDALGKRGKPAETVAAEGIDDVLAYLQQPHALDEHLPDQLLPFMALAQGPSVLTTMAVTEHTRTNAAVIGRFIERAVHIEGHTVRVGSGPGQ
ncbi:MAG: RNA 3'-phosphate cyclase [Chloroflexi bacterium]|nr:RNA 3'-phosphate cyclase [Chloroflexota bacterium]